MFLFGAICTGASAYADAITGTASPRTSTPLPSTSAGGERLAQASSSSSSIEELRQEIQAEHQRTIELEERLNKLQQDQASETQKQTSMEKVMSNLQVGRGNERTPTGASQADVYDRGFFLRSKNGRFSLSINGLAQIRYSLFKPNAISRYGFNNNTQSDFEIYLGRLAFSGNVFDPSLKYFFQIQGFTTATRTT
jgi:hypothetical protein